MKLDYVSFHDVYYTDVEATVIPINEFSVYSHDSIYQKYIGVAHIGKDARKDHQMRDFDIEANVPVKKIGKEAAIEDIKKVAWERTHFGGLWWELNHVFRRRRWYKGESRSMFWYTVKRIQYAYYNICK